MIYTRKLGKIGKIGRSTGGSYYVTLPLEEVKRLRWKDGQTLFVHGHPRNKQLIVEGANYKTSHKP